MSTGSANALDVVDLDVAYRVRGHWRQVLRGVSLEVPDGQNTVIIGASGGGKSVTLKLVVGLIEPDAGEGTDMERSFRRRLTQAAGGWRGPAGDFAQE